MEDFRDLTFPHHEGALVVLSGGQDSTTCLFWALKRFSHVRAICFRYGQKHVEEVHLAEGIAREAGVPITVLDAGLIGQLSHNALTDSSIAMDSEKPADALPNTFVPGRNLFFLSIAAVHAREHGLRHLVTGVSQTDFSGYPDCRAVFIRAQEKAIRLALDFPVRIVTPFMKMTKADEWALAAKLGVFDLIANETVTCYNGIPGKGCGRCPACKLRNRGLKEYERSLRGR